MAGVLRLGGHFILIDSIYAMAANEHTNTYYTNYYGETDTCKFTSIVTRNTQ